MRTWHLYQRFYKLLEMYNCRVEAIEMDKSVMIEIPPNLLPKDGGAAPDRAVKGSRDASVQQPGKANRNR